MIKPHRNYYDLPERARIHKNLPETIKKTEDEEMKPTKPTKEEEEKEKKSLPASPT